LAFGWIRDLTEEGIEPNPVATSSVLAGDGVSEKPAYRAVALKIVELLRCSMIYQSSLSRTHAIEAAGATSLRATVAANDLFQNAVMEAVQNTVTDFQFAGEHVQLKTTSAKMSGRNTQYDFNLHHGHIGSKRRPYDAGIAFAFVVVGCSRFYYFSKEQAKEHHLVGEGAPSDLGLPHPDKCALDPNHDHFPFLDPRPRVSRCFSPSSGVKRACQWE
jgi:hypothetical protein